VIVQLAEAYADVDALKIKAMIGEITKAIPIPVPQQGTRWPLFLYPRPPHVTLRGARVKVKPADGQRQCRAEISRRFPAVTSAAIAGVSVERAVIADAANVQPRANRAGIGFKGAHKAAALFDRCQRVAAQSERRRQFAAALMASLARVAQCRADWPRRQASPVQFEADRRQNRGQRADLATPGLDCAHRRHANPSLMGDFCLRKPGGLAGRARTALPHTLAFNEPLKGLSPEHLRYSVIGPQVDISFVEAARQRFVANSAYLDDRPGAPLRFLTEANLTQVIRAVERSRSSCPTQ
jgi:hypothetical protein